ncbi:Hypothetical predicted protein [Mytilus galloprovincialis]|uniref:Uncharacterized protein n=1 Tax=Mytilus galloprovincialis TaxID=29158 RepID=A0A8B6DJ28_MYTGA|nr:Hypothetical predicted protein [Mytilus galloprovincialis]
MFNPLTSELETQLPTSDSNNCIAVDQTSSQQILFNQSYRNQGKGNVESNVKLKVTGDTFSPSQDILMMMNQCPQLVDLEDMVVSQSCTENPCLECFLNFQLEITEFKLLKFLQLEILLINEYLPSRGTDSGHDAYRAALDT